MSFEFIQIPVNGQSSAKEELNKLLRGGRIASVKKEFVSNGEDSFWAFCVLSEQQREQLPRREPQQQQPGQQQQQHRVPLRSQLRPMGMDFPAMSQMGLNRLPSRSHPATGRDKMTKSPPGDGRPVDAGSKAPGGPWAFHSHRRSQTAATRRTMRGTVATLCERRCQSVAVSRNSFATTVIDRRYKRSHSPLSPTAIIP
jgi:hypothetical protein